MCSSCSSSYTHEDIDEFNFYLCPICGKAEKNQPLSGVLSIEYDYENISNSVSCTEFLSNDSGKFWLYPYLWPIDFNKIDLKIFNWLALPKDNLLKCSIDEQDVLLLDETRNPTLSYKDRATSLVVLKAIELGIKEIAAASTGNAGSSLAGICARLGLYSHIFVPTNIPDEKRIQIEAYGANLVLVDGDYDLAFDTCLDESTKNGWYNRNTAYNPLTIEGKKSAAFDIFIQTHGKIPETIIIPVGDGVIISGIYKGFSDLQKLGWIEKVPKLIGVQSQNSSALVRFIDSGEFKYIPATTIADSISAGAPRNLYMAAQVVTESGGKALSVSDSQILSSQKEFIKETGIFCEPAAAATFAAYKTLLDEKDLEDESVLLIITGNGLKDIKSLNRYT